MALDGVGWSFYAFPNIWGLPNIDVWVKANWDSWVLSADQTKLLVLKLFLAIGIDV